MIVEGEREVLDVVEELIAQVVRYMLGDVINLVALEKISHSFDQPQAEDD